MADEKFLQRDLGRTLIEWRERKGLPKDDATWFLGTSKDILNSYESGKLQFMEPAVVCDWLAQYGASQDVIDDARSKAKRIRQGSPANWLESAPPGFNRFTQLESLATAIDIYEDAQVTGLAQPAELIAAILETNPNLNDEKRDNALRLRLHRQSEYFGKPGGPPRTRIIQSEESLNRVRSTGLFDKVLAHLKKLDELGAVDIYVVPRGMIHPSTGRTYSIMSFADSRDPDVVYQEHLFGAMFEADKATVSEGRTVFSATLPLAKSLEEWSESDADE